MSLTLPDDPRDVYRSPFVTCSYCNAFNTLDGADKSVVPACGSCGVALFHVLGAHDFEEQAAALAAYRAKWGAIQHMAVDVLTGAFRIAQAKRRVAALRKERDEHTARCNRGATLLQSLFRGFVGRKAVGVQRALARIQNAHAEVLMEALSRRWDVSRDPNPPKRRRHVFWYTSKAELDMLFTDYRTLVERSGHCPPRHHVEANLLEIGRRVHVLESRHAVRIQAAFRGTLARVYLGILLGERARLKGLRAVAAIRVQRFFRARHAVRLAATLRSGKASASTAKWYQRRVAVRQHARRLQQEARMSLTHYQEEVRRGRTAVFTRRLPFGMCEGQRLKAMSAVGYTPPEFAKPHAALLASHVRHMDEAEAALDVERQRQAFIDSRVATKPALVRYFDRPSADPPTDTPQWVALQHERRVGRVRQADIHIGRIAKHFPFADHRRVAGKQEATLGSLFAELSEGKSGPAHVKLRRLRPGGS